MSADRPEAPFVVAIAGPTGVGKSALAIQLAESVGGEIVNYDSVQLYRGFDIGSAKPTVAERREIPHHLLDLLEATDEFNAADFQRVADRVTRDIARRGALPILVGGTGFYLRAFLTGLPELPGKAPEIRERLQQIWQRPRGRDRLLNILQRVDPVTHGRIGANDRHRVERALEVWFATRRPISSWDRPGSATPRRVEHLLVALHLDRKLLVERLDRRAEAMFDSGLVEETRDLLSRYPPLARPFASIGYAEAARLLQGELTREDAIRETQRRTRAYAKRQMTWLRAERDVLWISAEADPAAVCDMIIDRIKRRRVQHS